MYRNNDRNRQQGSAYTGRGDFAIASLLRRRPLAWAAVKGSRQYPDIDGEVRFYQTQCGVLVAAEFQGLPAPGGRCEGPVFGLHIHDGGLCEGTLADPFAAAGMHDNPHGCRHPYHAGDLPPVFGADGIGLLMCLTNRFEVRDIIGKTVILHARPDDFTSQPAGNAGNKMACGVIVS